MDSLRAQVLQQPNYGFTVPRSAWFRGDLARFVGEVLLSREARERWFFEASALEAFLRDHLHGTRNLGSATWSLLMFELWCREIFD